MTMLFHVLLGILVLLYLIWLVKLGFDGTLKWSEANRRANELLRSMLSTEQYDQLTQKGYLEIKSPRNLACIYRVPRRQGLVMVFEHGKLKMSLCLQPREMVPDADWVVIHKLMIEADEETYLQTANKNMPISNGWMNE